MEKTIKNKSCKIKIRANLENDQKPKVDIEVEGKDCKELLDKLN